METSLDMRPYRQITALLCALILLALAPSLQAAAFVTRATSRDSDENGLVRLPGNTSLRARPELDRGPAPDSLPQKHILMMLRRSQPRQRELEQFITRQYDPRSADFHRWLTPVQFGARFGPSAQDIEK